VLTTVAAALSSGPQPVLPGFLNALSSPLEHYGLWAVALLVLLEDFGIPVPGETVLIAGAIFAGSGRINVVALAVVGFAAAIAGDNIGYAIGRFGGRPLAERWGKYIFLTSERLDKAEAFFNRHGGKIITIARFVEGLRQANGIIAGIIGMHWLKFVAFNALGAALWVGTWVCAGYFAGQHITAIYHYITMYSLYAAVVAVVLIAAWVTYRVLRRRGRKRAAAAPVPAAGPAETAGPGTPLEPSGADREPDTSDASTALESSAADQEPGTTRANAALQASGADPEPDAASADHLQPTGDHMPTEATGPTGANGPNGARPAEDRRLADATKTTGASGPNGTRPAGQASGDDAEPGASTGNHTRRAGEHDPADAVRQRRDDRGD